jgi:hypothetical protein
MFAIQGLNINEDVKQNNTDQDKQQEKLQTGN